jgi:tetratricopeptide (TPR) repeat protein
LQIAVNSPLSAAMAVDPMAEAKAEVEQKAARKAKEEKRWTDALRHADAALAASPTAETSATHFIRGHVLAELSRYDEAIAAHDRSLELDGRAMALFWRSLHSAISSMHICALLGSGTA